MKRILITITALLASLLVFAPAANAEYQNPNGCEINDLSSSACAEWNYYRVVSVAESLAYQKSLVDDELTRCEAKVSNQGAAITSLRSTVARRNATISSLRTAVARRDAVIDRKQDQVDHLRSVIRKLRARR